MPCTLIAVSVTAVASSAWAYPVTGRARVTDAKDCRAKGKRNDLPTLTRRSPAT
jgi:hypothetical protein